ncbi:hypothetical protein LTR15_011716 [Elasticomyces elasticus]|nr:hypothetical protein LTR15_011716 [Elasticomyces elasticus]
MDMGSIRRVEAAANAALADFKALMRRLRTRLEDAEDENQRLKAQVTDQQITVNNLTAKYTDSALLLSTAMHSSSKYFCRERRAWLEEYKKQQVSQPAVPRSKTVTERRAWLEAYKQEKLERERLGDAVLAATHDT